MTSANPGTPPPAAVEKPWYDLIGDPEPPEDAMQQAVTIRSVMPILHARYRDDPTVLVSEQTNVIYDSAVAGSVVAPDGYVVFGVEADTIETYRNSYRINEWGVAPAFVLEVASESTASRDLGEKREIYARMEAREYWRLDRTGDIYGDPLVGERLVDGEYVAFELHTEANGDIWSRSEALGVDFSYRVEEGVGRFLLRDSVTGEWLNTLGSEIEARKAAEARNQELQAELDRLGGRT